MNRGRPKNPLYGFTRAPVKANHGFISVPLVVYHVPPDSKKRLTVFPLGVRQADCFCREVYTSPPPYGGNKDASECQ